MFPPASIPVTPVPVPNGREGTGTNPIAFGIGSGGRVHAVRIGPAAGGEIACVVADGRVSSGATYLGPVR